MLLADLKNMTVSELQETLPKLYRQKMKLQLKKAHDELSQVHLIGQVRRNIARVHTLITQKQVMNDDKK